MPDSELAGGTDLASSDREGICGRCSMKLLSGSVKMAHSGAEFASEIENGYILSC